MRSTTSAGVAGAAGGALSLLTALMAMNIASAMMRKSNTAWRNAPYLTSTGSPAGLVPSDRARSVKLTPPTAMPITGMTRSPTNELTILPNAAPMMMPTAMSMTLPFMANCLNSDIRLIALPPLLA